MGKFFLQCVMWASWFFFSWFLYTQVHYDFLSSVAVGFIAMFVMFAIIGFCCLAAFGVSTLNFQIGGTPRSKYSGSEGVIRYREDSIKAIKDNKPMDEFRYNVTPGPQRPIIGTRKEK